MSYTLAWILKCLKLYPSISLIDDSAAATQPLSRSARVADAATQPLCRSGWSSHPATQPLCQSGWSSHPDTQPLCQSGWSSHSATLPEWLEQPQPARLRHSATLPEWLEQPLPARVAGAAHSATLCQSGWSSHSAATVAARVADAATQLSRSAILPEWLEQPLSCQSGCQSG